VKKNKETPNLLSLLIKFVCEISYVADNYSTNLAVNLAEVVYFGNLFKNYTSYIFLYYWFEVGEATLPLHHLIDQNTPHIPLTSRIIWILILPLAKKT
jgi:hypothetical protein